MLRKYYILLVCLVQLTIGSAQPAHINFTSLGSREGLLSNSVNAMLKDRQGLMWFATDDGLNKFNGTNFTVYRHKPGDSTSLRANEVLALHEDKAGNLWVGTSGGGISLYDRSRDRFINYPERENIPGFPANAVIRGICSDYLGKIWIAQFQSPYLLDPVTNRLSKMELIPSGKVPPPKLTLFCVFEDSRHRMWVGTDQGLFEYIRAMHSFRQFRHDSTNGSDPLNDKVKALVEDKGGRLWVGTEGGLCTLQEGAPEFTSYRKTDSTDPVLGRQTINAIALDKDGMLWIGSVEGLHIMDPRTGHSRPYLPDPTNMHSLTSKTIRSIYIDNEGIYWIGTYRGGINKYDKNLNLFNLKLSDGYQENAMKSTVVTSFVEIDTAHLWVGTDGGGIYDFNPRSESLRPIDLRIDGRIVNNLMVLALKMTRGKKLYAGTFGNGLIVMDPSTRKTRQLKMGKGLYDLNSNDIYSVKEDSKGQIWLGTNGGGVNVLNGDKVIARFTPHPTAVKDKALPVNGYIRAIEEDADGNIWIGSHGSGLAVYHPQTGAFTVYNQHNSALPSDKIYALLLDSRGIMWIGTYGGGLSVFDKGSGRFSNYSERDGLQNSTIYQLVEDAQGRIWASTNTGVSCLDRQTRSFRNFTSYNGIPNANFVHASGIRLASGELFFGGLQGFNYFNPADLTTNRNVPTVVMTDLKIANKSVVPGDQSPIKEQISVAREIRLDYKQNFALSFVALNYTLPKENHYAYKLEGFDKDWIYNDGMNTAYYTNLDPGEYTFHVKASNNDGVWSATDNSIRIYVKPPFWRTLYAYLFYLLVGAVLLFYSRHRGISRIRKKFAMQQERQEALRVQELERLKLKFLTDLSHEFRTPISLIMGPVEQLLAEQNNPGSLNKLQMIRRNTRRLLNLVNQLLDFRKMEEKELRLQLSEGDFVLFVKEVCHSFTDMAERKHIGFSFLSDVNRLNTWFDRDKIERILFNLLSNAFKFTLEGGTISVALEMGKEQNEIGRSGVLIKVTDSGIGIPQDKKEDIFERFFQHHSAGTILNQGSGIGLSITKEFVNMHGGSIDLESEPGRGSVFSVRLPLLEAKVIEPGEVPPLAVEEHQSAETLAEDSTMPGERGLPEEPRGPISGNGRGAATERPSILLVEDNEDFRAYLKEILRSNYKIIEAANGQEGWQKALSSHPQLIVSDISMPGMDGIVLTRKLKADKRTGHIPVILLTALTREEQQLKGLETGANDYITKPFSSDVLNAKIRNLLVLRNTLKTTYSRQIKLQTPEKQIESEDEKLLHRVGVYLEENLTSSQLSVESLSKEVGMSRSTLYNKLLEITGETPVEYIRSYKLEQAAKLLHGSDLTIAEVAYRVGFSTPNYFAKAFRAKFNVLPSEYAARAREAIPGNGP